MNALATILTRGLRRLEHLAGDETVTINGQQVPCTATTLQRGVVVEIGGNQVEIHLTLHIRLDNFITSDEEDPTADNDTVTADNDLVPPVSGRRIVFRGATYLVVSVKRAPGGSHIELQLADPNSGT